MNAGWLGVMSASDGCDVSPDVSPTSLDALKMLWRNGEVIFGINGVRSDAVGNGSDCGDMIQYQVVGGDLVI